MRIAPGPTPRHPSPRTSPPSVIMSLRISTMPVVAMESLKRGGSSDDNATRRGCPIRVVGSVQEVGSSVGIPAIGSGGQGVEAGAPEQIGELLAGIEHPGLHRALGDPDDLAGFFHGFLMIV